MFLYWSITNIPYNSNKPQPPYLIHLYKILVLFLLHEATRGKAAKIRYLFFIVYIKKLNKTHFNLSLWSKKLK